MKLSRIVFPSIFSALLILSFISAASAETSITSLADGTAIGVGAGTVTGTANAPDGVAFVLVSTDGGATWEMATDTSGDGTWSTWSLDFTPPGSGPYVILARATDALGVQESPGARAAVQAGPANIGELAAPLGGYSIVRISVASDGTEGDSHSLAYSISANNRYVAFHSYATNLVPGDTNGAPDVFVHDLLTGITERVSVASDGTQGNSVCLSPSISNNGNYIAFWSSADNLVPSDTNGQWDVFVHDRVTGETDRVSVDSSGAQGNGSSSSPFISEDGRFVAFSSGANNLVPDDTNVYTDVFIHDRATGVTERVSVASDGTQSDHYSLIRSMSVDGRFVLFVSGASNLVPDDTNNVDDVFVHDRQTGETTRVSISVSGAEFIEDVSYASMSADGRYVAFDTYPHYYEPDFIDNDHSVYVHDRQTGETSSVGVSSDGTEGDDNSSNPHISADGRYVAFSSNATNLVPGDTNGVTDVFVHDRATGTTVRVNTAYDGAEADDNCLADFVSADGGYIGITSMATNLVPGDTNGTWDAFVAVNPLCTSLSLTHSQEGRFVTMDAELYADTAPVADANIKFYCSMDGGLTWRGRGRALTDASGVATKTKRFREGSYLIKAVYAPRGETPVESNVINCTVASVVALSPEHRAVTTDPTPAVTWEPLPGATGYIVQTSGRRSFRADVTETPVGLATSAELPAMLPDTKTFWRVVATIPDGRSVGSKGRLIRCVVPE